MEKTKGRIGTRGNGVTRCRRCYPNRKEIDIADHDPERQAEPDALDLAKVKQIVGEAGVYHFEARCLGFKMPASPADA